MPGSGSNCKRGFIPRGYTVFLSFVDDLSSFPCMYRYLPDANLKTLKTKTCIRINWRGIAIFSRRFATFPLSFFSSLSFFSPACCKGKNHPCTKQEQRRESNPWHIAGRDVHAPLCLLVFSVLRVSLAFSFLWLVRARTFALSSPHTRRMNVSHSLLVLISKGKFMAPFLKFAWLPWMEKTGKIPVRFYRLNICHEIKALLYKSTVSVR